MSNRHRSRRVRSWGRRHGLQSAAASVIAHPWHATAAGIFGCLALWIAATKSLPYALLPAQPDLALALNPNNPEALVAKAEALSNELLALIKDRAEQTKAGPAEGQGPPNTLGHLTVAKTVDGAPKLADEREALRREIRELALRAIENDPLNARAFRLLAEVTSGTEQVRLLMQQSFQRSRREYIAAFWLLNDSLYRKDYKAALNYSDILLRTRPELRAYVLGYLVLIADDPEGRSFLIERLAEGPEWRQQFFDALSRNAKNTGTPLELLTALKETRKPASLKEIIPYIQFLIQENRADLAYDAWLQFLPKSEIAHLGLLTNASFESKPSGLPFDWQIGTGVNAIAEIVPVGGNGTGHALHIRLGNGRIKFPEVSQMTLLPPGRYRLEGKLRGAIIGKRGLRWQLACASGRILGETEMLLGQTQQWRIFALEADVPQFDECRGEKLKLVHDARSASEELLTGEIWFSDLRVERIPVSSQ